MPKWKQFIKGDDLHKDSAVVRPDDSKVENDGNLLGSQVREIYEAIVQGPCEPIKSPPEPGTLTNSSTRSVTIKRKSLKPIPDTRTLFSLCESNNLSELSYYFENYSSELLPNVNRITDEYNWTLLMSASCAGSNSIVEYLLEIGADWRTKDKKGLTALDLANKKHNSNTSELILNWIRLKRTKSSEESTVDLTEEAVEDINSRKFCVPCSTEIKSERIHNKCIAHLVSTSGVISDRVHYGLPDSNKGFQLMLKTGWNRNKGLGLEGQGQKFPVKTILKRDRKGFGDSTNKVARVTHFGPFDESAVDNPLRLKRDKIINKEVLETVQRKARSKEANFRREFYAID